ncbi:MAG: IS110 family transposase [Sinobacterium sp.]|nr:IS110 family transposase [Sinobacterium sp.]
MRFYNNSHPYYCGIDLHARNLYICIIDEKGEVILHKNIQARPDLLYKVLQPYIGNIIVGVECMHCWYWVSDFCEDHGIDFIVGHALYMKAIHGGKAKNDKIDSFKIAKLMRGGNFPLAHQYPKELRATRDLLRRRMHLTRYTSQLKAHIKNSTAQYNLAIDSGDLRYPGNREAMRNKFPDASLQCNIDMDLNLIEFNIKELKRVELHVSQKIKRHQLKDLHILKSIQGIGDIIAGTILLEIGDIQRFPTVKNFSSYGRLVKCKAESAGKSYGTQGNKIGNAHLKWTFSEAAVLYVRRQLA